MINPSPQPQRIGWQRDSWPESFDLASFCATMFLRLGGSFTIDGNGVRGVIRPMPALFRIRERGLPQLPDAGPEEQFQNADEWKGAVKFLEYVLARLGEADEDLVFGALASEAIDDREPFDFREQLR